MEKVVKPEMIVLTDLMIECEHYIKITKGELSPCENIVITISGESSGLFNSAPPDH